MPYIYSTLTCDQAYTIYSNGQNGLKVPQGSILVKGGTGIANDRLITPLGISTSVSAEELEQLKSNPIFKQHLENGFIVVQEDGKEQDAEKVAVDMSLDNKDAPITPSDYQAENAGTKVKNNKGK
ncbi:hypothetical protein X808_9080 [Mannheimia varigena USDA-ARS-USMARC-1296]|uniref:Uncharacterized protein n=1 Tax=Mannheimia varigena USDA-ARS-USMARC-1296 TaxID=1433287 RepID=W0QA59_9PAST|nr:hypothetical protein [Mannheimia varigena]AHG75431.1 hypothetical protein X808_9080 [Mannheimia varigena USDA-ARS-USMARC-1296]